MTLTEKQLSIAEESAIKFADVLGISLYVLNDFLEENRDVILNKKIIDNEDIDELINSLDLLECEKF
jgi:hypothetical protein